MGFGEESPKQQGKELREVLRQIAEGHETAIDVVNEVMGEGDDATPIKTLVIRQRRVNPEPPMLPVKDRSPKREHEFYDVPGFVNYLGRYGDENTVVLADPASETVFAVLNERAFDGFEVVTFKPQVHPLAAPWLEMLDRVTPIRSFVDFLVGNKRQIVAPDARDLVMTLQQVKMSRQVELFQGMGKHSVNGLKVTMDIAGESKGTTLELPDELTINVPLYVGHTACQDIIIDLMVDGNEKLGVVVVMKSADMATSRVAAFELFTRVISEALTEQKIVVGLGTPRHGSWATLPVRQ